MLDAQWGMGKTGNRCPSDMCRLKFSHLAKFLLIIGVALALISLATSQTNFFFVSAGKAHYSNAERIVPASEILDKIKHGEAVEYSDIMIVGDLDISGLDLPAIQVNRSGNHLKPLIEIIDPSEDADSFVPSTLKFIRSPIFIINSTIYGNVSLNYTIFNSSVDFSETKFMRNVDFQGARFVEDAGFEFAKFNGSLHFFWAKFQGKAFFTAASFSRGAGFNWVRFYGDTYFPMTAFNGVANFEGARFFKDSYFWYSKFEENSIFTGVKFDKGNDFSNVKISGVADFASSQFNDTANFRDSELNGNLLLNNSKFYTLDLIGSIFTDKSFIYLRNSNFVRSDSARVFVRWGDIKDHLVYDEVVYLALINNFKKLGIFEDADNCYYQYRELKRDQESLHDLTKWTDTLSLYSCGYGVKPLYTIAFGIIVLTLFGFSYFLIRLLTAQNKTISFKKLVESLCFSAIILISAPKELYPQSDEAFEEHIKYIKNLNILKYLPVIERLIGWGLLILLINTLSRLMIRY